MTTKTTSSYERLEDVVTNDLFPPTDLALREGRHIDRDEIDAYLFLDEAKSQLEVFYKRFGCELVKAPDGYFYLRPTGDGLGRRHLSTGEMLVGQALALLYLDPATVQAVGRVTVAQLTELLANLVGEAKLVAALNPRRRRRHDHVDEETVRREIAKALRTLARLGFVDLLEAATLRVRLPVLRFADPVRGLGDPRATLAHLVQRGDAALGAEVEEDAE
jgi:chromosome partition protein MukE